MFPNKCLAALQSTPMVSSVKATVENPMGEVGKLSPKDVYTVLRGADPMYSVIIQGTS